MKILFIGSDSHMGGAERIILTLIRNASQEIHPVYLLGLSPSTDAFLGEVIRSSLIAEPAYGSLFKKTINRIRYAVFVTTKSHLHNKIIRSFRPDLIYAMNTQWISYAGPLARILKRPLVWHIHDMPSYIPKRKMEFFLKFKEEVSLAICICEKQKGELIEIGFPEKRVAVVHNGIAPIALHRFGKELIRTKFRIVFLGELSYRKGFDLVPSLFSSAFIDSLKLKIAGRVVDKELYFKVIETLHRKNICFEYIGEITSGAVEEVLYESDYLLLPSRSEVWPTVVMESMFCGCIPLISDVGGAREMIPKEYWDLLLFTTGMNTNIEKSVLKIENNKDLKLRIIQECRDYALKNFDIRMIARQWEKKIEETVYSEGKESAT